MHGRRGVLFLSLIALVGAYFDDFYKYIYDINAEFKCHGKLVSDNVTDVKMMEEDSGKGVSNDDHVENFKYFPKMGMFQVLHQPTDDKVHGDYGDYTDPAQDDGARSTKPEFYIQFMLKANLCNREAGVTYRTRASCMDEKDKDGKMMKMQMKNIVVDLLSSDIHTENYNYPACECSLADYRC